MTDVVFWVLFGALAGWVAALITGDNDWRKTVTNIGLGIIGAVVSGALMQRISIEEPHTAGLSMPSLLTATCGAVVLLALLRTADRGK